MSRFQTGVQTADEPCRMTNDGEPIILLPLMNIVAGALAHLFIPRVENSELDSASGKVHHRWVHGTVAVAQPLTRRAG